MTAPAPQMNADEAMKWRQAATVAKMQAVLAVFWVLDPRAFSTAARVVDTLRRDASVR